MASKKGSPFSGAPKRVPGAPRSVPGAPLRVPGGPFKSGRVPGSSIQSGYRSFRTTAEDQSSAGGFRDLHTKQLRNSLGQFAGTWGIAWQGLDTLSETLGDYARNAEDARRTVMDRLAEEMEAYMKANHPWENRTGAAEAGLQAVVVHSADRSTIWVGHGKDVPYGLWLEIMQNGRFAILMPTVLKFSSRAAGDFVAAI